jgi:excisionase family DNA binding protein
VTLFTTATAAAELGVTPGRVRAMITSGRLRATLAGRDWLIASKALEAVRDRKPGRPPNVTRPVQNLKSNRAPHSTRT